MLADGTEAATPMESERRDDDQRPTSTDLLDGEEAVALASCEDEALSLLATDRVDTAALESLFTERTEADEDERDDDAGSADLLTGRGVDDSEYPVDVLLDEVKKPAIEETDDDADEVDGVTEREPRGPDQVVEPNDTTIEQSASQPQQAEQPSRAASPAVESPQRSPTRPSVPARPPRPTAIPPQPLTATTSATTPVVAPPLQLITFDVGGKLFRCKASLIAKFPTKRLYHVISCGCEQIDHATYFIDRNPQHFELMLDWYRTGKCPPRPLPIHVNEDVLRDDARYFDLYEELFPVTATVATVAPRAMQPPTIPPRIKHTPHQDSPPRAPATLPRLPDRPARSPASPVTPQTTASALPETKAAKARTSSGIVRYSKRDTRVISVAEPLGSHLTWFAVKDHEHLIVESVKGVGKLLVRVTDATGMTRVFVDQAVLFDSRSWFYLEDDGRAKLQHCVLPGGHVYTFWMEPHEQGPPSPTPLRQAAIAASVKAKASSTKGKSPAETVVVVPAAVAKPELEVVFRFVSTFSQAEAMADDDDLASLGRAKGNGWGDGTVGSTGCSNQHCLFLPPRREPALPTLGLANDAQTTHSDAMELTDERDAIAEHIRALAAKDRSQKTSSTVTDSVESIAPASSLKRNGAAIAQQKPKSKQPLLPAGHGAERVTVYQPMPSPPVGAATPRSPAKQQQQQLLTQYASQQPRHYRQR